MKIEGIFTVLFILALILKKIHLPGSNIIIVTFLISISMLYFFFAFYIFGGKKTQQQKYLFSIVSGILLSIAPIAILFKIMNWNNGNIYIVIGLPITIAIFIISFFLKSRAQSQLISYYKYMMVRTGILTLLQLFCILI